MKTYIKRQPFELEEGVHDEDKDFVSLVLSEKESYWVYHEENACYPFMVGLIKKKIEKVSRKYEKPINVFDNEGILLKIDNL